MQTHAHPQSSVHASLDSLYSSVSLQHTEHVVYESTAPSMHLHDYLLNEQETKNVLTFFFCCHFIIHSTHKVRVTAVVFRMVCVCG